MQTISNLIYFIIRLVLDILDIIKCIMIYISNYIVEVFNPFIQNNATSILIAIITAWLGYYFNKSLKNRELNLSIKKDLASKQIKSYEELQKVIYEQVELNVINFPWKCKIAKKTKSMPSTLKFADSYDTLIEMKNKLNNFKNGIFLDSNVLEADLFILASLIDNYLFVYRKIEADEINKIDFKTISFYAGFEFRYIFNSINKNIIYFYKNAKGKNISFINLYILLVRNKINRITFLTYLSIIHYSDTEIQEIKNNLKNKSLFIKLFDKMKSIFKSVFYFVTMTKPIYKYIDQCKSCEHKNNCEIKIDDFMKLYESSED